MLYTLLLIVVAALAAGGLFLGFSREPSLRATGTGILGVGVLLSVVVGIGAGGGS
jgi:hypothetical protein